MRIKIENADKVDPKELGFLELLDADQYFWRSVHEIRKKINLPEEGWGEGKDLHHEIDNFKKLFDFSGRVKTTKYGSPIITKKTKENLDRFQSLGRETEKLLETYGLPSGWYQAFRDFLCSGYLRLPPHSHITLIVYDEVAKAVGKTPGGLGLSIHISGKVKKGTLVKWVRENWQYIDTYQKLLELPKPISSSRRKPENIPYLRKIMELRDEGKSYPKISDELTKELDEKHSSEQLDENEYERLRDLFADYPTIRKYNPPKTN